MADLWLDPFAGISGDMFLGALLDAGLPLKQLQADLKGLKLSGWSVRRESVMRGALAGTRARVKVTDVAHPHRGLREIRKIIHASKLPTRVQTRSVSVFEKLGQVEARMHGVPVEKIHFHEVGALDAVVDIVGVCAGLERLGVERLWTSAVNVGSGLIKSQHGWLPVPAPATAELLKGFEVFSAGPAAEHTTPTGAALLAALAQPVQRATKFVPAAIGYGAGERQWPDFPNLLRVTLGGEPARNAAPWEQDEVGVLVAHVDDAAPQMLGYAMEQLLAAGAWDVVLQPIHMKKNRLAHRVEVLCCPSEIAQMAGILFQETTTLGLRVDVQQRLILKRTQSVVRVAGHDIRVKAARQGKKIITVMPEYEDVKKCAQAQKQPWRNIAQRAMALAKEKL
jgi:uncharacterized protein (TIGR00299 family) protein